MATFVDPSASTSTTVTLRKRKRRDSLVIHLSSPSPSCDNDLAYTESEHDPSYISDAPEVITRERPPKCRKRYACSHDGCTKSYTKPSRLEEHERSHTGTRPYVCKVCSKSYLRENHLQAHSRTHLPSSAKPFACVEEGCGKKFWTSQHLRVHAELHSGEKAFKCTEPNCSAAFTKHHQLRDHIATSHAPPGTKPYRCQHTGCTKSFTTNQKLTAHTKTHDEKRYTCVHLACLPAEGTDPKYYPTWSALQHHTRTAHPPTCPHPSCNGKTFTQQKGLRAHLKIHAQRDKEAELDDAGAISGDDEGEDSRPRKRRRGGEVGRDWVCDVEGCTKDFKSKKALATHHAVAHLGKRDFVCPHAHCARAFGYKHLLQRHLAKLHAPASTSDDNSDSELHSPDECETASAPTRAKAAATAADSQMDIDVLTGRAYAVRAKDSVKHAARLQCPHPHLPPSLDPTTGPATASSSSAVAKRPAGCQYVFSRAYDFRRHLLAEHGLDVERERVDQWVRREKEARA